MQAVLLSGERGTKQSILPLVFYKGGKGRYSEMQTISARLTKLQVTVTSLGVELVAGNSGGK